MRQPVAQAVAATAAGVIAGVILMGCTARRSDSQAAADVDPHVYAQHCMAAVAIVADRDSTWSGAPAGLADPEVVTVADRNAVHPAPVTPLQLKCAAELGGGSYGLVTIEPICDDALEPRCTRVLGWKKGFAR